MKRHLLIALLASCQVAILLLPACSKKETPASAPTNDQPPDVPALATPANGDTGVALSPTLTWNVANRATSYNLQVATDSAFTGMVSSFTGINSTMKAVTGLSSTTDYCWRVSAVNNIGTSEWSASWRFRTRAYVNPWTTKAPMPTAVWAVSGVGLNGKVYAVGGASTGSDAFWEYDPVSDSWTAKQPMPGAHGAGTAVAAVSGKIYVIGGQGTNENHEYDQASNSWKTMASMPTYRYYASATVADGVIYLIGGLASGGSVSTVEAFDPVANSWSTKAPMSAARHGLATVEVSERIYAIGGHNYGSGTHYSLTEEYNPASNTWAAKTSMPTARRAVGYGVVNNLIYIIGGENTSGHLSMVEVYNPLTNAWAVKTPMPAPRSHFGCGTDGGNVHCFGGLCSSGYQVTTNESYAPGYD
jgi:hypothetical protein